MTRGEVYERDTDMIIQRRRRVSGTGVQAYEFSVSQTIPYSTPTLLEQHTNKPENNRRYR